MSNDGLWDCSLKCLWSLLWVDIFLSMVRLPAISLTPRSSQLWLHVYLLAVAQIILCSSQSSENCQVHIQLIPEGLSSTHHTLLSFWPYSTSLTFMSFMFSYLSRNSNCSRTFLTSSMARPPKWEWMILSMSLSIHPAVCKNVRPWKKPRCSKLWKFNQQNVITQIESKRLHKQPLQKQSVTFTSVDVSVKEHLTESPHIFELNVVCKYFRSQLLFEGKKL